MSSIPQDFVQTTHDLYGAAGTEWLCKLPELIADYAVRWTLDVSPPFENLSYSYVAPVQRPDGIPVVLKVG